MNNRIDYHCTFFLKDMNFEMIKNWCEIVFQYYTPTYMSMESLSGGRTRKYNEKKFYEQLPKEIEAGIEIRLDSEENYLWFGKSAYVKDVIHVTVLLQETDTSMLDQWINQMMIEGAVVAYKRSLDESVCQNTEQIDMYKRRKKHLWGVKLTRDKYGDKIINIEANPGHDHLHRWMGIWFGSCHKMWFGKDYYQYIPKDKLKSFTDCYENIELDNEVIRITLYEDIWAYEKRKNRKIQWKFRKEVGMDEVAHRLDKLPVPKEYNDPEIEITNGVFPNGGVKLFKYYYDSNNKLISKSKAQRVDVVEFAEDGSVLSRHSEKL